MSSPWIAVSPMDFPSLRRIVDLRGVANGEEIHGQHRVSVGTQELGPWRSLLGRRFETIGRWIRRTELAEPRIPNFPNSLRMRHHPDVLAVSR